MDKILVPCRPWDQIDGHASRIGSTSREKITKVFHPPEKTWGNRGEMPGGKHASKKAGEMEDFDKNSTVDSMIINIIHKKVRIYMLFFVQQGKKIMLNLNCNFLYFRLG